MLNQDFYKLKRRAIGWMVDPVDDGGLGLEPPTAAAIVGHDDDDGYLIPTVCTKLARCLPAAPSGRRHAPPPARHRLCPVGNAMLRG